MISKVQDLPGPVPQRPFKDRSADSDGMILAVFSAGICAICLYGRRSL